MSEQQQFCEIALEGGTYEARATKKFLQRKPYEKHDPRVIKALIPGVVAEVGTQVGKTVQKGETLMILEAMKMLNRIKAPVDGTVKAINVAAAEKVTKGQVLIELA
ncbi:acetyl-CoA carboxylase biotin carboxyl carrier protein subunit [Propionivibrio sp.]|jgi:biotin carboxyl carrier protein|uniref:acetyl-CoA carboxylase biotin carboxyl carrier protein subunit n=1 Tax=Propionivibrio sp. TaxID=2212460 RepID=UPI00272E7D9F|nr:acetyl-CoA carboxylase biotin carboxyl carrier protein subunit [Propionivibrio sp.]